MPQLWEVSSFLPPLGFGTDLRSSGLLIGAFNSWACSPSMALNSFCSLWGPWPCNPIASASKVAKITGLHYQAWLKPILFKFSRRSPALPRSEIAHKKYILYLLLISSWLRWNDSKVRFLWGCDFIQQTLINHLLCSRDYPRHLAFFIFKMVQENHKSWRPLFSNKTTFLRHA